MQPSPTADRHPHQHTLAFELHRKIRAALHGDPHRHAVWCFLSTRLEERPS